MTKINHEEYEVLKELDNKWKWIARDEDSYYAEIYQVRPYKAEPIWFWDGYTEVDEIEKENLFQFIQWEDEEPYSIAELIKEYEKDYKGSWEHAIEFSKEMRKESEETEVKKEIECLKTKVANEIYSWDGSASGWGDDAVHEVLEILDEFFLSNKGEEPTLSEKEKVKIPQLVADWYESAGKHSNWWNWIYKWGRRNPTGDEEKVYKWFANYNEENFVNMFRYGYEAKKEPKYYVLNNEKYFLLGKDKDHGFIFSTGGNYKLGSVERTSATFELTEQEIKDYDPRYWPFRKPVEELEE